MEKKFFWPYKAKKTKAFQTIGLHFVWIVRINLEGTLKEHIPVLGKIFLESVKLV